MSQWVPPLAVAIHKRQVQVFVSYEGLSLLLLSGVTQVLVSTEVAGEEPPARRHQRQRQQQQQQHQQTGIDGECLLSGLIAPHLEDLTVAVNERGRGGMCCWQPASRPARARWCARRRGRTQGKGEVLKRRKSRRKRRRERLRLQRRKVVTDPKLYLISARYQPKNA